MKTGRPSKSAQNDFARRLRELREAAGLSQRDIARELGIAQPSYANWELYNVALKPEQLTQLAKILGVSVAVLVSGSDTAAIRGGPKGRTRRAFETVSRLPRSKQQRIVDVVEALVAQNG